MDFSSASKRTAKALTTFVTGAFSLIAALAWNTAIQNSLKGLDITAGQYVYALVITLISCAVVVVMAYTEARLCAYWQVGSDAAKPTIFRRPRY